jgi:hypothetical protein
MCIHVAWWMPVRHSLHSFFIVVSDSFDMIKETRNGLLCSPALLSPRERGERESARVFQLRTASPFGAPSLEPLLTSRGI